ncbi:MAG TPA: hypothetical protein GX708_16990 [Gallicola sp.]|nr:hypothetical protein [Gallicola sp.]
MKTYTYNGRLVYNDFGQFELQFSKKGKEGIVNISKLLDQIYYSDNNVARVKVSISTSKGLKIIFNEEGYLIRKKIIQPKLMSYHINSYDLETKLFDNTGNYVEIEITAKALQDKERTSRYETRTEQFQPA